MNRILKSPPWVCVYKIFLLSENTAEKNRMSTTGGNYVHVYSI